MRVELPKVESKKDAQAHAFPVQIAFQALEFMQGAIFYHILTDTAASQRIRQPKALTQIEEALRVEGMSKTLWEEGWSYLEKYQDSFVKNVRQSVLITLRSHWDWYISHLGAFIQNNYAFIFNRDLSNAKSKELLKIGFKDIVRQLKILKNAVGLDITLSDRTLDLVQEMSLVRNLGLHNRWEVDQFYLDRTKTSGWALRDIRTFDISELEEWHSALVLLVSESYEPVAVRFHGAPEHTI